MEEPSAICRRKRQIGLLSAVKPYLDDGRVHGIRLSTRPDALGTDRVRLLADGGVTTVEIGAQSMDDLVLLASGRGHTVGDVRRAAANVKAAGMHLCLQIMLGLPGEDLESRSATIAGVLDLAPRETRIYPLVVLEGTPLAAFFRSGRFTPMSLARAVRAAARAYRAFTSAGIRVIRVGLHAESGPGGTHRGRPVPPGVSGTWSSPSFFYRQLDRAISQRAAGKTPVVFVSPSQVSEAVGWRNYNRLRLVRRHRLTASRHSTGSPGCPRDGSAFRSANTRPSARYRRLHDHPPRTLTVADSWASSGPPNAGKSTLLNNLLGEKIAITSDKPPDHRATASWAC